MADFGGTPADFTHVVIPRELHAVLVMLARANKRTIQDMHARILTAGLAIAMPETVGIRALRRFQQQLFAAIERGVAEMEQELENQPNLQNLADEDTEASTHVVIHRRLHLILMTLSRAHKTTIQEIHMQILILGLAAAMHGDRRMRDLVRYHARLFVAFEKGVDVINQDLARIRIRVPDVPEEAVEPFLTSNYYS